MTKTIEITNREGMRYSIIRSGFYYKAAWQIHNDDIDIWEGVGLGIGFGDKYKTEANAMRAIKRHADKMGFEIA